MNSNSIERSGIFHSERFKIIRTLFLLLTALLIVFPTGAHALKKATISWQANPPGDYVLGYRLYYSSRSRYTPEGILKPNFLYDYYIDFFKSERCVANGSGTTCEQLGTTDLVCENLFTETPSCTIYNLPGRSYFFAMTAYNTVSESEYTRELRAPGNQKSMIALQHITALLLSRRPVFKK